uniref:SJCHGC03534 protein n=1 Tax=Schistosoma japonicum TaxID=6182 RepID=Q5DCA4_SCHJA|nr:SJCHGC03534 protein [Schistosoma japonicum]
MNIRRNQQHMNNYHNVVTELDFDTVWRIKLSLPSCIRKHFCIAEELTIHSMKPDLCVQNVSTISFFSVTLTSMIFFCAVFYNFYNANSHYLRNFCIRIYSTSINSSHSVRYFFII